MMTENKDDMSQKFRMFYFVVYTIFYETLVWALVVLWLAQGWSAWILLLGVIVSSLQFQPQHFGITASSKDPTNMDNDEYKRWKEIQGITKHNNSEVPLV